MNEEFQYRFPLTIQSLSLDAAVEYMCLCLGVGTSGGGTAVPRKLRDFVTAVSINIPTYIEECLAELLNHGCVEVRNGEVHLLQDLSTVNIAEWVHTSMVGGTISHLE